MNRFLNLNLYLALLYFLSAAPTYSAPKCKNTAKPLITTQLIVDPNLPKPVIKALKEASEKTEFSFQEYLRRNKFKNINEAQAEALYLITDPNFEIILKSKGVRNRQLTDNRLYALYAESIRANKMPAVEIKWIPAINGRGVFATQKIKKGDYLGQYAGVLRVIDWKADLKNMYLMDTGFYYRRYYQVIIDGLKIGSYARYLNHSSFDVDAPNGVNAVIANLNIDSQPIHFFIAARDIEAGEQILISYGKAYWEGLGVEPFGF